MNHMKFINVSAFLVALIICLLIIIFITEKSYGKILYDGESEKFNVGTELDSNGSQIYEDTTAPQTGKKHIRIILVKYIIKDKLDTRSKSSAVGYGFNNWNPIDLSKYKILKFSAKSSLAAPVFLTMLDHNKNGDSIQIQLDSSYQNFAIPLSEFGKINFKKVTTLIFHSMLKDLPRLVIDVDNIEAI